MVKNRRTLLYAATGALVVALGAFALAYFVLFPSSSPDEFTLGDAPAATATAAATETPAAAGASQWTVAEGSQAGYRVREKLAFLSAKNDAVGRTSDITGQASPATRTAATSESARSASRAIASRQRASR